MGKHLFRSEKEVLEFLKKSEIEFYVLNEDIPDIYPVIMLTFEYSSNGSKDWLSIGYVDKSDF